MHRWKTVEAFLRAREEGLSVAAASARAGVSPKTGRNWSEGRLPHSYGGAGRRIPVRKPRRKEPAMEPC